MNYHNPICAVDMCIFSVINNELNVLLMKRAIEPAKGCWALPGGVIDVERDQTIESTAIRKLKERTGVDASYLEQVGTVGNSSRDPRDWSITVVHFALLDHNLVTLTHDNSADEVQWFPVDSIGTEVTLALDHEQLLNMAIERLQNKTRYSALPIFVLPEEFTLTELVNAYRAILGEVGEANLRKRLIREGVVVETGEARTGPTKPAKLYRAAPDAANHYFARTSTAGS